MRTNRSLKSLHSQRHHWKALCQLLFSNKAKSHQQELYLIYVLQFSVNWELYLWRFQNEKVSHCNSVLRTAVGQTELSKGEKK